MVRPHSYHYSYQGSEMQIIQEDVKNILQLGGNKIVFGSLNADLTINEAQLASVINISKDLLITFHRAFDKTPSVINAYRTLTAYHDQVRSEEHTSELHSRGHVVCRLLLEKTKQLRSSP